VTGGQVGQVLGFAKVSPFARNLREGQKAMGFPAMVVGDFPEICGHGWFLSCASLCHANEFWPEFALFFQAMAIAIGSPVAPRVPARGLINGLSAELKNS
jgi:hypothetical protein